MTWFRWSKGTPEGARAAERTLMESEGVRHNYSDVKVGPSKNEFIHSVTNERGGPNDPRQTLVIVPGYAAGLGFYFKNVKFLSAFFKVDYVDWLGTGLSGRPPFKAKTTEEAESFFVDSLALYMRQKGYDKEKVILVGHSLGGYLSLTYAHKYPEHVKHLVVVGSAGIPERPKDFQLPERFRNPFSAAGMMLRVFRGLWAAGTTPGGVIRSLGPWGQGLVEKYATNRFRSAGLTEQETGDFGRYMYEILAAPGSGEYALQKLLQLLQPYAFAHKPWENRLETIRVPITFIYGEHDWMRPEGGYNAAKRAFEIFNGKRRADNDLNVFIMPNCGHFPFLDEPRVFDTTMHEVLKQYIDMSKVTAPEAHPQADLARNWSPAARVVAKGDVWRYMQPTEDQQPGYRKDEPDVEPIG